MHLQCDQKELAKALSIANHAVSQRSTLPILANLKLETNVITQTLLVSATNLEIGIRYIISANVKEAGATTVPAKTFIELVSSLRPGIVEILKEDDTHDIQIKTKGSRANLKGMDPSEFPAIPDGTGGDAPIMVDSEELKEIIAQVAFAAADDDARPVLTGVLVEISDEKISFASADAFRLALRVAPLPGYMATHAGILIPAHTLKELMRILPSVETVKMIVTPNLSQVVFQTEHLHMVSRLIEGTFPNIRAAIPDIEKMTEVSIKRKELEAAVKAVMPFARDSSNIVHVKIQKNIGEAPLMILHSIAEDVGSNEVTIPIEFIGTDEYTDTIDQSIIFNARYMSEVLPVLPDTITFAVQNAARPGLITYPSSSDNLYQYVIMPMSTNR